MTHIRVSRSTIITSDNDLSPGRRPAIIWTNAGMLLVRTIEINFSETLSGIYTFSCKKMHLKVSSAKWRQFCPGLNVLNGADEYSGGINLWHTRDESCRTAWHMPEIALVASNCHKYLVRLRWFYEEWLWFHLWYMITYVRMIGGIPTFL